MMESKITTYLSLEVDPLRVIPRKNSLKKVAFLVNRESQTIYASFKNRSKPQLVNTAVTGGTTAVRLKRTQFKPRFSVPS